MMATVAAVGVPPPELDPVTVSEVTGPVMASMLPKVNDTVPLGFCPEVPLCALMSTFE
jgi:hypothetical protein